MWNEAKKGVLNELEFLLTSLENQYGYEKDLHVKAYIDLKIKYLKEIILKTEKDISK